MIWKIGFYATIALLFAVIGGNARHAQESPAPETPSDVQEVVHQEQSELAQKDKEITGLELQLQHERDVSRGIGLMELDPGAWQSDWTATWYAEGGINGDGVTATGKRTTDQWTIAVDPAVIPLGSVVEVRFPDGDTRIYQALDTGGAIRGKRLDIYDPSVAKCVKNGRQQVSVRILKRG